MNSIIEINKISDRLKEYIGKKAIYNSFFHFENEKITTKLYDRLIIFTIDQFEEEKKKCPRLVDIYDSHIEFEHEDKVIEIISTTGLEIII